MGKIREASVLLVGTRRSLLMHEADVSNVMICQQEDKMLQLVPAQGYQLFCFLRFLLQGAPIGGRRRYQWGISKE